jgi:hypothetical protein
MSIVSLRTNSPGQNYQAPRLCELQSSDALATVVAAGYLNPYIKMQSIALYSTDVVQVAASDGNQFYKPVFSASGQITLTVLP